MVHPDFEDRDGNGEGVLVRSVSSGSVAENVSLRHRRGARSQAWRQLSWNRSRVIGIGFTRSSARSTTTLQVHWKKSLSRSRGPSSDTSSEVSSRYPMRSSRFCEECHASSGAFGDACPAISGSHQSRCTNCTTAPTRAHASTKSRSHRVHANRGAPLGYGGRAASRRDTIHSCSRPKADRALRCAHFRPGKSQKLDAHHAQRRRFFTPGWFTCRGLGRLRPGFLRFPRRDECHAKLLTRGTGARYCGARY